jgi:hypothetical protein
MQGRSAWTGQPGDRLVEVRVPSMTRWGTPRGEQVLLVEPEHEAELRGFLKYAVRFGRTALVSYLACSVVAVVGAVIGAYSPVGRWLIIGSLLALGGLLFGFPFATPETVATVGVRRSRQLARGAGALLIALALAAVRVSR